MGKLVAVFSLCILVNLTGCVSTPYPGDWARQDIKSDDCPDLTGSYENYGDMQHYVPKRGITRHTVALSGYLLQSGDFWQKRGNFDRPVNRSEIILHEPTFENGDSNRIVITGPKDGKLHVAAYSRQYEAKTVAEIDLSQGWGFKCDDGLLSITDYHMPPLFPLNAGPTWDTLAYVKAEDGALIAHGGRRFVGVMGIFYPVWMKTDVWIRFQAEDPKQTHTNP